jgi:hypothetical protein
MGIQEPIADTIQETSIVRKYLYIPKTYNTREGQLEPLLGALPTR